MELWIWSLPSGAPSSLEFIHLNFFTGGRVRARDWVFPSNSPIFRLELCSLNFNPNSSSLLTSLPESGSLIWSASLTRRPVMFVASSSTRVWSHSTWWWLFQACSAIADFSSSPRLVAALCSASRGLSSSLRCTYSHSYTELHAWHRTSSRQGRWLWPCWAADVV